jgi:hypothetical protein
MKQRNLFAAEIAPREIGVPSLVDGLDYLELLAAVRPDKFDRAAVPWHGRLETEAAVVTIAEMFAGEGLRDRRARMRLDRDRFESAELPPEFDSPRP